MDTVGGPVCRIQISVASIIVNHGKIVNNDSQIVKKNGKKVYKAAYLNTGKRDRV